ncbi:PA2169 family four-helix-bundle protein [Ovoidimarina sediminis]|uniref:PA2169 family four-helix-bundle protein n=1 Tax=Ovoidimarina sediminis TaxID=3079856 RepID=UPI00290F436A|nr:PA2169 family four-helix-bundle protein [Rhodophyticola sp. MJ-SS7]MDU8945378.1 PA2169 family four-helix-bundle protein [Rhodophyticola sp. MJ-SS7]
MAQRLNNLNDIIAVLKGGADFYRKASRQSDDGDLSQLFLQHAELRETVARDLSNIIEDVGGEVKEGSAMESTMKVATQASAYVSNKEKTLVSGLEEHEDRTLAVFRKAIHHPDNARDEEMLANHMAQFEQSHERMKALKEGNAPAAKA